MLQCLYLWTSHADDVQDLSEANLLCNLFCRLNSIVPCSQLTQCAELRKLVAVAVVTSTALLHLGSGVTSLALHCTTKKDTAGAKA